MLSPEKHAFIEFMMGAGVLRFGDFITKSGRNTPYFVNTGNYRTGAHIATLSNHYARLIVERCGTEFSALFGPAYKGIPLAAGAAAALYTGFGIDKPYFFNRKEAKDHGEGGSLIGYQPQDGDSIVIVEDVITAGTALREVMPTLRACADVKVPHMAISVDRCEKGSDGRTTARTQAREAFGIEVHSIVSVLDILEYLEQQGTYADVLERMGRYIDAYCLFE